MKSYDVTIQMKATEQYFPVVLFIMLYKVVLSFGSRDEILCCGYSIQSYWAVIHIYERNLKGRLFSWKLSTSSTELYC